ncbi:MAG TPA: hypothetical protein VKB38_10775 [Terracidiphilus sp.]|nr:hypothetical protein [Terracidiphilus sp.]
MSNHGSIRQSCVRLLALLFVTTLFVAAVSGCSSKQEKALEQAKKQAAATGQPQQVVTVDKAGNTITTVVQPPAQGQKEPTVVTTTAPPPAGSPAPAASDPTVSPVGSPAFSTARQPLQMPQPPAPVNVSIPAGTSLAIRVDQRISVKTSHAGDQFTGEVVEPVAASDGGILVPKGAPVKGVVDASHKRGHFKGASILQLRLTSVTLNGTEYPLETRAFAERKKGKGKRSAAFIGGGSGLGMLVGGVASGGVGLLVGGLAGAGAGTAAAGLTGNRDIDIPAETVVRFTLADDLVVQEPAQQQPQAQ